MNTIKPMRPNIGATALGGLIAGVVTGATVAMASTAKQVKKGDMSPKQAGAEVLREAGSLGLATTIGAATTAALGFRGVLSIASLALVTAGSKYAIDAIIEKPSKKNNISSTQEENIQENTSDTPTTNT